MRVFRPQYKDKKTGERRESRTYHIAFRDHVNVRRRVVAGRDKASAESIARKLTDIVKARKAGDDLGDNLAEWVENAMDRKMRTQLIDWRVLPRRDSKAAAPLGDHFAAWLQSMKNKGVTPKHIVQHRQRALLSLAVAVDSPDGDLNQIESILACFNVNDIDKEDVETALAGLGVSARTRNAYAATVRGFFKWCVKNNRAKSSPVEELEDMDAEETKIRRALSEQDVRLLVSTVYAHKTRHHNLTGPERATAYWLAVETGLRAAEIRQLNVGKVRLSATTPYIIARAPRRKNKKRWDNLTISRKLADWLHECVRGKSDGALVFRLPTRTAEMLRQDLEIVGLPYRTEDGDFDFHSLRCQCATFMASNGVPVKAAQQRIRHSTSKLTMDVYAKFGPEDDTVLVAMPDLSVKAG